MVHREGLGLDVWKTRPLMKEIENMHCKAKRKSQLQETAMAADSGASFRTLKEVRWLSCQ